MIEHLKVFCARKLQTGQSALESLLVLGLVGLIVVLTPDNALEQLLIALEGRHQAILRHAAMP